jgi:hypothetical protein
MINCCNGSSTDMFYPMLADIYYPVVSQSPYGNVTKAWTIDDTIPCSFSVAGSNNKQDVIPDINVTIDNYLIGRTKRDIRTSVDGTNYTITNVLVTNIRDKDGNVIYRETSGPRAGNPTVFEIATNDPIQGPFNNVEYFKVIIRRAENQGVDLPNDFS